MTSSGYGHYTQFIQEYQIGMEGAFLCKEATSVLEDNIENKKTSRIDASGRKEAWSATDSPLRPHRQLLRIFEWVGSEDPRAGLEIVNANLEHMTQFRLRNPKKCVLLDIIQAYGTHTQVALRDLHDRQTNTGFEVSHLRHEDLVIHGNSQSTLWTSIKCFIGLMQACEEEFSDLDPDQALQHFQSLAHEHLGSVLEELAPALKQKMLLKLQPYVKDRLEKCPNLKKWLSLEDILQLLASANTLHDMMEIRDNILAGLGSTARNIAIDKLQPTLDPFLKRFNLTWTDAQRELECVKNLEDLRQILIDPEIFVTKLIAIAGPAAKKAAIEKMRPMLDIKLEKYRLSWVDAESLLQTCDTLEEIQELVLNPEPLLQQLLRMSKTTAFLHARALIEPMLTKWGFAWDDMQSFIDDLFNNHDKLRMAIDKPKIFLQRHLEAIESHAVMVALSKLRPKMQPLIEQHGLTWDDALPAIETVGSFDDLQVAMEDPQAFLDKLLADSGPAAVKLAIGKLRPQLKPLIENEGVEWVDALPAIETVGSLDDLQAAMEYPQAFLDKFLADIGPAVVKLAIGKLRSQLEPLVMQKVAWRAEGDFLQLYRMDVAADAYAQNPTHGTPFSLSLSPSALF
jgi:hypothetical protein